MGWAVIWSSLERPTWMKLELPVLSAPCLVPQPGIEFTPLAVEVWTFNL